MDWSTLLAGEEIGTVWQLIADLRSSAVVGYEALSRGPVGSGVEAPEALFEAAARDGEAQGLEQRCISLALGRACGWTDGSAIRGKLFVNASPDLLQQPGFAGDFAEQVRAFGVHPRSVVVEVTEGHDPTRADALVEALSEVRSTGFLIALDDVGAGLDDLRLLELARPDVVKLDRSLISGVDRHPARQAALLSVTARARRVGACVVAEGIETAAELVWVRELGVEWGQGFFLGRPAARPLPLAPVAGTLLRALRTLGKEPQARPASWLTTGCARPPAGRRHTRLLRTG